MAPASLRDDGRPMCRLGIRRGVLPERIASGSNVISGQRSRPNLRRLNTAQRFQAALRRASAVASSASRSARSRSRSRKAASVDRLVKPSLNRGPRSLSRSFAGAPSAPTVTWSRPTRWTTKPRPGPSSRRWSNSASRLPISPASTCARRSAWSAVRGSTSTSHPFRAPSAASLSCQSGKASSRSRLGSSGSAQP